MKKLYKMGLSALLMLTMFLHAGQVSAAEVQNGAVYPIATNGIQEWPQGPDLYSETAVLMDADTGAVLYDKGMNEKRYPASITKIMTALLALENCTVEENVTFTETCLADQVAGSGNIGMKPGEVLTMKQALLAMMVQSANDVATQIGEHVAGTVPAFIDMMNQRAQDLGCVNTHFVNASGMPDENHYSTAYDMALIFQEAIKNDIFREIIQTQVFTIDPTNMNPESRTYSTHHALVAQSAPEYYEGCFGGKTGVTDSSKNTLVSGAHKNGMTLIAVAMRTGPGEVCQDHINLFNYGFENFKKVEVPGGSVTIPANTELAQMQVVETVKEDGTERSYYYPGNYFVGKGTEVILQVTQEPQITEEPQEIIEEQEPENPGMTEEEREMAEEQLKQVYRYIIYIFAGLVVLAFLITVISAAKKGKKRR